MVKIERTDSPEARAAVESLGKEKCGQAERIERKR